MHGIVHVAYACECFDCPKFRDEIPFKEGRCKTREIPISGNNRNFNKNFEIYSLDLGWRNGFHH